MTPNSKEITGSCENCSALDVIRAVELLIPHQVSRQLRYELTYDNYRLARTNLFKTLPYCVRESKSFPLFSGFSASIEKVAEFRGEHGEQVEFRHRNTKIIYSAEILEDDAYEGFEKGLEQELERAVGRWPSAEQAAAWKRSESWLPGGFVGAGRAEVEEHTRSQPTQESQKLSGDEKKESTMKCAICEDEIKGKGKKLADGNTVCKDCYDSSAVIVTCEECGKEVLATSAVKECGFLYCVECWAKNIQEEHEWPSWVAWQEWCEADGETPNFEKWIARVKENIAESGTRAWKKTALEVATREIEEARKARRQVAA